MLANPVSLLESRIVASQLQTKRRSAHRAAFFKSWLQDPFNVASVVPSSRWLAKLMATGLHRGARVLELGAGTGTLTTALLEQGVNESDLYLVEQNDDFAAILRTRFPAATVLHTSAEQMTKDLQSLVGTFDYAISGLPILWFNREKKSRILEETFALLKPAGCLHQFTYLGRPPVGPRLRASLGLQAELIGMAPMNLPPAFVHRFTRA
jgi:phosphatidylethanolamine/phosphatidyl-N-methylethanolamine N-methyltransferase